MKNASATAGLMKMATLPEINMEYWMEYRDLILAKWVPDSFTDPIVATKFPALPANVSYNTQGVLDKSPLDMSNIMG
ncbi:hypothetical protein DSO57_1003393 [Entomophthora muscae]|uniref:Uncharacterized protein n=1 Tax=Entomophthora muscae TaxID=34485 RepID=A0ACC2TJ45_9FUNG|nr:hypothetical protein DSO57_1003393 [Entomophthora muscae]